MKYLPYGKGIQSQPPPAPIPIKCTMCPKIAFYLAKGKGFCETHRQEAVKLQALNPWIPAAYMRIVLYEDWHNYTKPKRHTQAHLDYTLKRYI